MPTTTLAQVESQILGRLEGNSTLYPEAEQRRGANEGLRYVNIMTGFTQARVFVPGNTVAGQYLYSCPAGVDVPLRVDYEGRELERTPLTSLSRHHPYWWRETTSNCGPVQHWTPIGNTRFLIHPADASGGRALEVFGVAPVTPLAAPAQPITLDDAFMEMLVEYAAHRMPLKEGGEVFSSASGQLYPSLIRRLKQIGTLFAFRFPRYWILDKDKPEE